MAKIKASRNQRILHRFTELAEPFILDECEGLGRSGADCYLPPKDPDGTMASLLEKCDRRDLVKSGLIVELDDGSVGMSPEVARSVGPIIALRRSPQQYPHHLVTRSGILASNLLPMTALLKDATTRRLLEKQDGILFLCADLEHAAALRAFDLAAVPRQGFAGLPRDGLQDLANALRTALPPAKRNTKKSKKKYASRSDGTRIEIADHFCLGETPPSPEEEAKVGMHLSGDYQGFDAVDAAVKAGDAPVHRHVTIVVACWHPLGLTDDQTTGLQAAVRFLEMADRVLGVDLGDVAVWIPTPEECSELDFTRRHGDPERLRLLVRESVLSSNVSPAVFVAPTFRPQRPALSFLDALRALQQVDIGGHDVSSSDARWAVATAEYQDFAQRDLLDPLLAFATEQDHPATRLQLALAVEDCCLLFAQTPDLLRQLREGGISSGNGANQPMLIKSIDQHLRISDSIARKIKSCKK